MSTKIPGPKGEPVSLALAVHSALSTATVPVSWLLHGDSETVEKMSFISQETLNRTSREILERFVDRAPRIETFLLTGQAIDGNLPDDADVRGILSQAYHLLNPSDPMGQKHRTVIATASEVLELGQPLPDRTGLRRLPGEANSNRTP